MADGDYVRLAQACHCGAPIAPSAGRGLPPKFCIGHRQAKRPYKPKARARQQETRVCALGGCGTSFTASIKSPQKYCGRNCTNSASNNAAKTRAERVCETCALTYRSTNQDRKRWCSDACRAKALRGLFSCLHCKAEFTPKKVRCEGEGTKYCSRQCARAARAAEPIRGVCAYYAKACAGCGRPGGKRRDWTRCEACLAEDRRRRASNANRAAAEAMHRAAARVTTCAECQATYCRLYGNKEKRFGGRVQLCSVACQEARRSLNKRVAKSTRAARKRGTGKVERIDPLAVFTRDGWRCQLCGRKTPKAKRGTCADNAPELDHIVPLSKGGSHSLTNVHCACRACNSAKGGRPLGQLLLIG